MFLFNKNLDQKIRKKERKLRKVTFFGYAYLILTIIIKKLFSTFNIEIKKKQKNFDEIYLYFIKKTPYIFDVGANTGQSIKRFRNIFPNCIIHSFEPVKECFDSIKLKYNEKNIILNNFALGESNKNRKFNHNTLTYTSSFLNINNKNKNSFLYEKEKNNKPKVKIEKLDHYVKQNNIKNIDILKIDTQGYEIKVLQGAMHLLKKRGGIKFIELEVTIQDIYIKSPNLFEIDFIMHKNNFILYQLGEFSSENINNKLTGFDALYINSLLVK